MSNRTETTVKNLLGLLMGRNADDVLVIEGGQISIKTPSILIGGPAVEEVQVQRPAKSAAPSIAIPAGAGLEQFYKGLGNTQPLAMTNTATKAPVEKPGKIKRPRVKTEKSSSRWTSADDALLLSLADKKVKRPAIAAIFGRSTKAINERLYKHNAGIL